MAMGFRKAISAGVRRLMIHHTDYVVAASVSAADRKDEEKDCVAVESVEELEAIASEIPSAYPLEKLRQRIAKGWVLLLLRRKAATSSGREVVGLRMCERGVFYSLGLRIPVSQAFLFIHHAEVLPEHRGKRIARELARCSVRYGTPRGITVYCGVITAKNAASLAAHLRGGESLGSVVAKVHRFSFLGGRFVWRTPARKILRALDRVLHRAPTIIQ